MTDPNTPSSTSPRPPLRAATVSESAGVTTITSPFADVSQPQEAPAAPSAPQSAPKAAPAEMPRDFVYDTEHPVLPIPFKATVGEYKLDGVALSVTAAYVAIDGPLDPVWKGQKEVIRLQFDFPGFTITIFPEAVVTGSRRDGEMTLQFMDPAGAHLPQLRYILNSYIAGDFVSLGGMLGYTGPTQPKAARAADNTNLKFRLRSIGTAVISAALILVAAVMLMARLTQSYELRPVFIERLGKEMKATTAGQVGYLNPKAKAGEVVFSVNANTGDVLNFKLPCDCEVVVTEGIFEGATVLPIDSILSFFDANVGIRLETQMSIEGLAKAMSGERLYLDLSDGRTVPVEAVLTSATNASADRGDPFVPVTLVAKEGAIGHDDIGKTARLRLTKPWFDISFLNR